MGRRLQELGEKKAVDQLHKEFVSLEATIALLQVENVELKNQLRIALIEKCQKG